MSYLLRLWQVSCGEGLAWRASLESARTGERHGFASLDELSDFLRQPREEGEVMNDAVGGPKKTGVSVSEISRREETRR